MFRFELTYVKTNKFGEKDVCTVPLISMEKEGDFVKCNFGGLIFRVENSMIISIANI